MPILAERRSRAKRQSKRRTPPKPRKITTRLDTADFLTNFGLKKPTQDFIESLCDPDAGDPDEKRFVVRDSLSPLYPNHYGMTGPTRAVFRFLVDDLDGAQHSYHWQPDNVLARVIVPCRGDVALDLHYDSLSEAEAAQEFFDVNLVVERDAYDEALPPKHRKKYGYRISQNDRGTTYSRPHGLGVVVACYVRKKRHDGLWVCRLETRFMGAKFVKRHLGVRKMRDFTDYDCDACLHRLVEKGTISFWSVDSVALGRLYLRGYKRKWRGLPRQYRIPNAAAKIGRLLMIVVNRADTPPPAKRPDKKKRGRGRPPNRKKASI